MKRKKIVLCTGLAVVLILVTVVTIAFASGSDTSGDNTNPPIESPDSPAQETPSPESTPSTTHLPTVSPTASATPVPTTTPTPEPTTTPETTTTPEPTATPNPAASPEPSERPAMPDDGRDYIWNDTFGWVLIETGGGSRPADETGIEPEDWYTIIGY